MSGGAEVKILLFILILLVLCLPFPLSNILSPVELPQLPPAAREEQLAPTMVEEITGDSPFLCQQGLTHLASL